MFIVLETYFGAYAAPFLTRFLERSNRRFPTVIFVRFQARHMVLTLVHEQHAPVTVALLYPNHVPVDSGTEEGYGSAARLHAPPL